MNERNQYALPLTGRYAGPEMSELWGDRRRFALWRTMWIVLAEAERELGLPISLEQIEAMKKVRDSIDFAAAADYESKFRHDVMAHVHAFGDAAPLARPIIHLGATSAFVTDNVDAIQMRTGFGFVLDRLVDVISNLRGFALRYRDLPTLGYTHFQPAQMTTVGKRAALWIHDFLLDYREIARRRDELLLRGAKGTTGTQASFLELFDGDHDKVRRLDRLIAEKLGFPGTVPVCGQTYTRKIDVSALDALSGVAQSAHKFATDLRLGAHRKEIEEPFEKSQIGSSAMAYKRNPMRCERICGLARYVMSLPANAAQTVATQWFERTLDDSSNRRLTIPQAFLGVDAILRIAANVTAGLVVHPAVIGRSVAEELPFMATEGFIMAAVKRGGDRQELHEVIRRHSHEVAAAMKDEGLSNDLIDRLKREPAFAGIDWNALTDPARFVGRSKEQVDEFLDEHVDPLLKAHRASAKLDSTLNV